MTEAVEYAQKALAAISYSGNWGDGGIDNRVVTQAEDALEALIAEHKRVTADGYIQLLADRADAAEARLSAVAEVIERHARIERHNDKVPLSNLSELKREPTSAEYRAALDAADKVRREQAQGGSGE